MPRRHERQPMHDAQRCLSRRLLLSLNVIVQVIYLQLKVPTWRLLRSIGQQLFVMYNYYEELKEALTAARRSLWQALRIVKLTI